MGKIKILLLLLYFTLSSGAPSHYRICSQDQLNESFPENREAAIEDHPIP